MATCEQCMYAYIPYLCTEVLCQAVNQQVNAFVVLGMNFQEILRTDLATLAIMLKFLVDSKGSACVLCLHLLVMHLSM